MRTAGAVETWSSPNSTWSRRRRMWPPLLAKRNSGWTGRELRLGNCHGLRWWLWNPSPRPSFFSLPDQVWTNKQDQTEGHTATSISGRKGFQLDLAQSQKECHIMTKPHSFLSLLPYPTQLPPPRPSCPAVAFLPHHFYPPSPRVYTKHPGALAAPSDIIRG